MAVARAQGQGGFTAIHVWLIVFVFLWLTSTVLLVILYLDQEKNRAEVADMRAEIDKVISTAGKRVPQFAQAKAGSGSTMVDLIESARAESAELVSGTPADQPPKLHQDFDAAVGRIRDDQFVVASGTPFNATNYGDALDEMYRRYRTSEEARAQGDASAANLTRELEAVRGAQTGQRDEFNAQAEQLRAEIAKLRAEYDEARQGYQDQVAHFEEQLESKEKQCFDDIQAQRTLTANCTSSYNDLLDRYQQQTAKLGQSQVAPLPMATARREDGKILDAKPGDQIVYIDLGKGDHLTLGLEFAVYDALAGIPQDGRAKARISVVNIFDKSAACSIVARLSNDVVKQGDLIANPVYDKDRTLKFYALGEFDLNGDGRADPDGRDRIDAIIERWGGQVESRLNAQLDFVVLGGPPPAPRRSPELDEADDVRYLAAKKAYEDYQAKIANVEALAIPRLTQSVFLNFLGLTRTPVAAEPNTVAMP